MSGGTESRTEIMPTTSPDDTGFMMPEYDFGGNVPTPRQVGVRSGGSISDVVDAVKGVAYYTDLIGFGGATSGLTQSMGVKPRPLGINFFTKTGMTCDNGADMWQYFQGIPKGDALGKTIQNAMAEMGLPAMRGIAPGMIEDVQAALDPTPILQATFGSVYPKCVQATLPVGDGRGYTTDPASGDVWVQGPIQYTNGPVQTKWIQATNKKGAPIYVSADVYKNTPKTMKPDGTPNKTKEEEAFSNEVIEGFENGQKMSVLLAVLFLCGAAALSLRSFHH